MGAEDLVQVTAPSDLPEGYDLEIQHNGQTMSVIVPAGGVKQGRTFQASPVPVATIVNAIPDSEATPLVVRSSTGDGDSTGRWKEKLCSCLDLLPKCNPLFFMAWFLNPIVLGQVMQRMGRSWIGTSGGNSENTCKTITILFAVFWVLNGTAMSSMSTARTYWHDRYKHHHQDNDGDGVPDFDEPTGMAGILYNLSQLIALLFLVAHVLTRHAMRRRFEIAPRFACGDNGAISDCCTATFCTCCSLIQMARQTHDEDAYPYEVTSPTGLPQGAPAIV